MVFNSFRSQRNTSYHKTVRPPTLEPRGKQRVSINTPIVRTAVSESMPIAKVGSEMLESPHSGTPDVVELLSSNNL